MLARAVALLALLVATAAAAPLAEVDGDLDGKRGNEHIALAADGTLSAGAAQISVEIGADPDAQAHRLSTISLGNKRRAVMLVTSDRGGEDPPARYRIFLYRKGSLILVYDAFPDSRLEFDSRGSAIEYTSGWEACGKTDSAEVKVLAYTLRFDSKKMAMVTTRRPSRDYKLKCDELSACPYVYELGGSTPRFVGEILRDLRGPKDYALQTLSLPSHGAGTMRIRIAEEKPEVTYLDELYVEVDGTRVRPKACATTPAPAYCVADARYHVMARGESFDVELDVSDGARTLFARGFYIPTP